MRRLVALALALVAVPVVAWAILGSGSHARAAAPPAAASAVAGRNRPRAATPAIPAQGGSTCFVAAGTCSETPCVEFVRSRSAVLVAPAAGPVARLRRGGCPAGGPSPARPGTHGGPSAIAGPVPALDQIVGVALARASRALSRRAAAGGG